MLHHEALVGLQFCVSEDLTERGGEFLGQQILSHRLRDDFQHLDE
jgi:hypothetical protein